MKHNNRINLFIITAISILMLSCSTTQTAVEKAEKATFFDKKYESLDFNFIADYAYPLSFQPIYLTSHYRVTVTPDTVTAYLPYYGRAYRAPMNSSEGGIKFESTDFESEVERGRKDEEWLVTIRTKDTSRAILLSFHLWNNGTAQLVVNDPDRQSISFKGTIEDKAKE